MNTFLWALQIILAIKLLTVTLTHGLQQNKPTIQEARLRLGRASRPLLYLGALGGLLGTLGLILPGALGTALWLTPISALAVIVMLLVSLIFHLRSRDRPYVFVSLVLSALAAVVAWGRWV